MKRLQLTQKLVYGKFSVREIAAMNLSKFYLLKNAKKTCIPNKRNLNRDLIIKKKIKMMETKWFLIAIV